MQAAVRLAARRGGRGARLFWTLLGLLVSLVVSIATYDYLTSLLQRFPLLGKLALVLVALLALIVAIQLVRELWAFRRLARIQSFHAEAAAVHATADRDAALALSRRLERFYAGRPELRWNLERLARAARRPPRRRRHPRADRARPLRAPRRPRPPRDRGREPHRRRRHRPHPPRLRRRPRRPLAERPHGPPHRRDLRRPRRLLRLLAPPPPGRHPPPRHRPRRGRRRPRRLGRRRPARSPASPAASARG